MPNTIPLIKIGLALTGFPKAKQLERYVAMHSDESRKCKDIAARVFYYIAQFFLTFICCSDIQRIIFSARSLISKTAKAVAQTLGIQLTKEHLDKLKQGTSEIVVELLNTLVKLNKSPSSMPESTVKELMAKAKAANKELRKGYLEPMVAFFKQLTVDMPEITKTLKLEKLINIFDKYVLA